ncbi:coiled-coil domain-containing protein-domain-containing protein [Dimargaris cristalligena]|uniref:Coiled-coil domain-containing protein-domain-containing protein n=1 Tax=Dimargaris cristalligena TaxID=215637 RepID=A0A4P9ZRW8_9FUNG|nr:coiled-coil domain-containing protein-domain-containing protein [Dimargaris cristalligena]|eukprot:RKP36125.1 coiled-coil domain-containing protein-domain-containing protein [Dimargaris cristalligena]
MGVPAPPSSIAYKRRLYYLRTVLHPEGYFDKAALRQRDPVLYHHHLGQFEPDEGSQPFPDNLGLVERMYADIDWQIAYQAVLDDQKLPKQNRQGSVPRPPASSDLTSWPQQFPRQTREWDRDSWEENDSDSEDGDETGPEMLAAFSRLMSRNSPSNLSQPTAPRIQPPPEVSPPPASAGPELSIKQASPLSPYNSPNTQYPPPRTEITDNRTVGLSPMSASTTSTPPSPQLSAADLKELELDLIQISERRFLAGLDRDFDYSVVDDNELYDDIRACDDEVEEAYFDSEEPN